MIFSLLMFFIAHMIIVFSFVNADIIHDVAAGGHPGELMTLIASGKEAINKIDSLGRTPLIHAAKSDNYATATLLLDKGADISISDTLGRDALDWALVAGARKTAHLLVKRGANIDRINSNGNTRILAAALRGDFTSVEFYLFAGSDYLKKNERGLSPADAAKNQGHMDIASLITTFEPSKSGPLPKSILSVEDSLKLYKVSLYQTSEEFFEAVQNGRRSFAGCTLKWLDLSNMNLSALDLGEANLESCDMRGVNFRYTSLKNANLRACYLKKVDLSGADLSGAVIADTYLNEANLDLAIGLSLDQLKSARNLFRTKMEEAFVEYFKEHFPAILEDPKTAWDTNQWANKESRSSVRETVQENFRQSR